MTKRALVDATASPLQRASRALESVARSAELSFNGATACFPLPAVAFKGDDEHELSLPLRPQDVASIKQRGLVAQRHGGVDVAWDVPGHLVESRNPEWQHYLDARLRSIRGHFGIFSHEEVEMPLRKMMLVETNARLLGDDEDRALPRPSGAFGTFVVVLPGRFTGGEVSISDQAREPSHDQKDDSEDDKDWFPDERDHPYYVSYVAFYDHCNYTAAPLQSGSALCLVFDLVTTPSAVDLLRGPQQVQRCVDAALSDYFKLVPEPLSKRLKISCDAWKTITEFAADRNFVYILSDEVSKGQADSFEDLHWDERLVAESLAAFCAQSNGEYVLYLARALCLQHVSAPSDSDGSSWYDHEVDSMIFDMERSLALQAPWVKYGESMLSDMPPVYLNYHRHVAPVGRVDQLPLSRDYRYRDQAFTEIAMHIYGDRYRAVKCAERTTHALVVQPTSVEATQLTKVPIPEVVERLHTKLSVSPEEALRYARRVVSFRPVWHIDPQSTEGFQDFIKLLVEINDVQLFKTVVLSLELHSCDTTGTLTKAVQHFNWDSCERIIVERLLSVPTLRGCVTLLVSVIDPRMETDRIDRLLDTLVSRHPWSAGDVDRHARHSRSRDFSFSSDFQRLLDIVYQSSPQRLIQVVSVTCAHEMVHLVAAAVISFLEARTTDPHAWRVLLHVRNQLVEMAPEIRNGSFTEICVTECCDRCRDIQAFLSSTAMETVIPCTTPNEVQHVKAVVIMASTRWLRRVDVDVLGETSLRLTKKPSDNDYLVVSARVQQQQMDQLLARRERPRLPDLPIDMDS